MPRPVKIRRVETIPLVRYFKPSGIPLRLLEEIQLSVDEIEAVRLRDIEKLEQENCAKKMSVSRATFQRILTGAREKIAIALLKGNAIRIEGGTFEIAMKKYRCSNGHEWMVSFEQLKNGYPEQCPECFIEIPASASFHK